MKDLKCKFSPGSHQGGSRASLSENAWQGNMLRLLILLPVYLQVLHKAFLHLCMLTPASALCSVLLTCLGLYINKEGLMLQGMNQNAVDRILPAFSYVSIHHHPKASNCLLQTTVSPSYNRTLRVPIDQCL